LRNCGIEGSGDQKFAIPKLLNSKIQIMGCGLTALGTNKERHGTILMLEEIEEK
jgi:hypothetical protein